MTIIKNLEPYEVLENFYMVRDIKEDDLEGKLRTMRKVVVILDFPYNERTLSLCDLELQFLREQGFNYL